MLCHSKNYKFTLLIDPVNRRKLFVSNNIAILKSLSVRVRITLKTIELFKFLKMIGATILITNFDFLMLSHLNHELVGPQNFALVFL